MRLALAEHGCAGGAGHGLTLGVHGADLERRQPIEEARAGIEIDLGFGEEQRRRATLGVGAAHGRASGRGKPAM
jgi:hypothetical protein